MHIGKIYISILSGILSMSGDSSGAAAVLKALDNWYSKRVNGSYDPEVALFIHRKVTQEAESLPPREHQQLEADFVWTFPSRAFPRPWEGFFSCRYARFDGYLMKACGDSGDAETREMQTIAPAHAVRKTCSDMAAVFADLAEGQDLEAIADDVGDRAFKFVFGGPQSFAVFSMGYLSTRVLSASLMSSCAKMPEHEHAMRARNFRRVCPYVELFSETVFSDLVH